MKTETVLKHEATLTLTAEELRILNNAMNEALEALNRDPDEFETRMGVTAQEVANLLHAINAVVREMD